MLPEKLARAPIPLRILEAHGENPGDALPERSVDWRGRRGRERAHPLWLRVRHTIVSALPTVTVVARNAAPLAGLYELYGKPQDSSQSDTKVLRKTTRASA